MESHTLLTAQRRMGKTSLVRELLRVLAERGEVQPIFVDLEAASNAEDAIAEIAVQSRHAHDAWVRIKSGFVNVLRNIGDRVDTLSVSDIQVKLRAGIDTGNWRQKGDEVFSALAGHDRAGRARNRRTPNSREPASEGIGLSDYAGKKTGC